MLLEQIRTLESRNNELIEAVHDMQIDKDHMEKVQRLREIQANGVYTSMMTILACMSVFCAGLDQIEQPVYKGDYQVDKTLILSGIFLCTLRGIGAAELYGMIS